MLSDTNLDQAQAEKIARSIFFSGELPSEMLAFLNTLPAETRLELRDEIGDLRNLSEPGYRQMLTTVDETLASQGTVVELGAGSGLMAAYLALHSPRRRTIAYEHNPRNGPAIQRRLQLLPSDSGQVSVQLRDFLEANRCEDPAAASVAGASVCLTLFHLPRHSKEKLLAQVRTWLSPGGVLVVQDPVIAPGYPSSPINQATELFERLQASGLAVNQFQFALMLGFPSGIWGEALPPDYNHDTEPFYPSQLAAFIAQQGFSIERDEYRSEHGYSTVVAQKR